VAVDTYCDFPIQQKRGPVRLLIAGSSDLRAQRENLVQVVLVKVKELRTRGSFSFKLDMIGYFASMSGDQTVQQQNELHGAFRYLLVLLLLQSVAWAQLVNPSFEEASAFPSAPGMWHLLPGWNNALSGVSSPDFFHLDGTLGGDLPETPLALVNPADGRGIAGLAVIKRNGAGQPLSREYLVQAFQTPLVVGQSYSLSFMMTNGNRLMTSLSGLAVNGVGIALSENQPAQFGTGALDLLPVFQFPYARYDEDWEQVTFSFVADAPHRFMTVGVFLPDEGIDAEIQAGENPSLAYYFFDAFRLEEIAPDNEPVSAEDGVKGPEAEPGDSPGYGMFVPNAFSPNGDGLNDWFKPEVGLVRPVSFGIYSRWGERIAELDPGMPQWDGRTSSGELMEPGVYIWRLEWPRDVRKEERSQQGAVMLLR